MNRLPSRHRRLDDALADLPLDEPMLLSELDGFLTGIALCREPIPPAEWMQHVWGNDDSVEPPFEHPEDVAWFAQAVGARFDEIVRELVRGKPRPIFEIDERNGDVLWELWIEGFAEAMAMRPDAWVSLVGDEQDDASQALLYLTTLVAVARNESTLDSVQINELQDDAPALIEGSLAVLQAWRTQNGIAPPPPAIAPPAPKVGRNDPCPCGSGKKSKRCCG